MKALIRLLNVAVPEEGNDHRLYSSVHMVQTCPRLYLINCERNSEPREFRTIGEINNKPLAKEYSDLALSKST